jgi:ABC-type branched-subunit amino acid transport system substrate-binding protein
MSERHSITHSEGGSPLISRRTATAMICAGSTAAALAAPAQSARADAAASTDDSQVPLGPADKIPLGLFDDLRGGIQLWRAQEAIALAAADLGRIYGRTLSIEWVTKKAANLPGGSLPALQQAWRDLASEGVLGIIGPAIGDDAIALAPLIEELRVPAIQWSGSEVARGPYTFHYQFGSLEEDTAVLAAHLARTGIHRVALFQEESRIGAAYHESFSAAALRHSIEILALQRVAHNQEDVSKEVGALAASRPDGLVYMGLGLAAPVLSRSLAARKWDVPVFLTSAGIWGHIQPSYAEYFEGWTYIDTFSEDNPLYRDVTRRLWGSDGIANPGGALFYDMAYLLIDAVYRARPLTRAGVRDALQMRRQIPAASGRRGTMLSFGNWDRAGLKGSYLVVRQWQKGRSVEVSAT